MPSLQGRSGRSGRQAHAVNRVDVVELEQRITRAREELDLARARLHGACRAVTAAEHALLAWREEREEAALRLARLADELERLEGALDTARARGHAG